MADLLAIPELTDGRVTLRAHDADDVDAVLERCLDPRTQRWTTVPLAYTREMAQEYVAGLGPSAEQVSWAIVVDDRYAGTIDLRAWGRTPGGEIRAGNLGFVTHPRARGRGVMTAAVRLATDHAFDTLRWETVVWQANVGNVASYRAVWPTGYPLPTFVPSLLVHRGELKDGWHSPLQRDEAREPACTWDEARTAMESHVRSARHPG